MPLSTRRLLVLFIICVATVLRAHGLLQIEHNVDQAYPIGQALNTLDLGVWPTLGQQTSVLFANPPLTGYLYIPFVGLARSALAAYVLVIGLNTLGVWCAWRGVRLLFGDAVGLVAAWLIAVNPWVIEYSRNTWTQSLLPFFVPLLFWLFAGVWLNRSKCPARRLFAAWVALALVSQTYLLAYLLLAPVAVLTVVWLVWPPPLSPTPISTQSTSPSRAARSTSPPCPLSARRGGEKRALIAGVAVFAAATAFYGVALLRAPETGARLVNFGGNAPHLSAEALNHAVRLVSGADYALARGTEAPANDSAVRQQWSELAHWAIVACMLAGAVRALWSSRRPGYRRRASIIALVWFGLPVLLMSYVGQVVHPFYLLLTLPAGAALAGYGLLWPFARLAAVAAEAGRPPYAIVRPPDAKASGYTTAGSLLKQADNPSFSPRHPSPVTRHLPFLSPKSLALGTPLLLFGLLMAINSARYAEATAATPGAHGLGALPLGVGLRLGDAIRESGQQVVMADVDRWTLESLAGRALPGFRRNRNYASPQIIPSEGGLQLWWRENALTPPDTPIAGVRNNWILSDGTNLTFDLFPPAAEVLRVNGLSTPMAQVVRQTRPDTPVLTLLSAEVRYEENTLIYDEREFIAIEMMDVYTVIYQVQADGDAVAGTYFVPFLHIVDTETGETLHIVEGFGLAGENWHTGDVLVQRIVLNLLDLPVGIYDHFPFHTEYGQYDSIAGENLIFILPDGHYVPTIEAQRCTPLYITTTYDTATQSIQRNVEGMQSSQCSSVPFTPLCCELTSP